MCQFVSLVWVFLLIMVTPVMGQTSKTLYTGETANVLKQWVTKNNKEPFETEVTRENVKQFYNYFKLFGRYNTISDSILVRENPFITPAMLIRVPPKKNSVPDSSKTDNKEMPASDEPIITEAQGQVIERTKSINWQSAILDGTARFLAERFKEELAAYYLTTFHEKLANKPVVKALFPKSISFLRIFANQVYNTDIAMLQAAAEEDLNNYPENMIHALDHIAVFNKKPLIKTGLSLALDLYLQHKSGNFITDIINTLPLQDSLPESYRSCFSVLRILSNALRFARDEQYSSAPWGYSATQDFYDPSRFENSYFYALLYEQLKNETVHGATLQQTLGRDPDKWRTWFRSFTVLFQDIKGYNYYVSAHTDYTKKSNLDFWVTLLHSSRLINHIYPIIEQLPGESLRLPDEIHRVAANNPAYFSLIKRVEDKRYEQVIPATIMLLTSLDTAITHQGIVPYMRFAAIIAQFATIRTAADMKNLLQSIALPVGSTSIKRKTRWNIAFNAYVGAAAGQEQVKQNGLKQNKTSIGLSAPLGVAVSHQYSKPVINRKAKLIPSGTLYLSFLDIGNLVNVRLKSDTTSIGNVRFSHFISLGAGYFFNFRNSPFSAGVSWSYVPGYRDAFIGNKWVYKADAVRIRFSLLVDIPLFNLYTKPND